MIGTGSLVDLLEDSCNRHPDKVAVTVPDGEQVTYSELQSLSDAVRDRLCALGIRAGDRVALRMRKSAAGIAVIFGILKTGATYIPIDPESPPRRAAYILNNCGVKILFADRVEADLRRHLDEFGASPNILLLKHGSSAQSLGELLTSLQISHPAPVSTLEVSGGDEVAYILYTSGSTGNPKGVILTHGNALSFINWCSAIFHPGPEDRVSSHAPFHFDLSIFDIFVSIKHASTLVLIGEALGKQAMQLARVIASEKITIWYSTPSILGLLMSYGKIDQYDYSNLRIVLFAGEVFPIAQYVRLRAFWHARFFNLYGPTETNVCVWYEVPNGDQVTTLSTFPIGQMCVPNRGMIVDKQGNPVKEGEVGELVVSGPNVMRGYWDLPEQNARAFLVDREGTKWYHTGDLVREDPNIGFLYLGREDRMVKRRGYRVELGEIEATLLRHEGIQEAAVVAVPDVESGVRLIAYVISAPAHFVTVTDLKTFSLRNLSRNMIPDEFVIAGGIPRTSTHKVDYEELKRRAASGH